MYCVTVSFLIKRIGKGDSALATSRIAQWTVDNPSLVIWLAKVTSISRYLGLNCSAALHEIHSSMLTCSFLIWVHNASANII